MASIRQIAQDVLYEAQDGIAWIALYKKGRSWNAECFWGLLDEQEVGVKNKLCKWKYRIRLAV